MKERPIIFNAHSVRSILSGVKIMTRRVIKPQPIMEGDCLYLNKKSSTILKSPSFKSQPSTPYHDRPAIDVSSSHCSYGQPGDRLWVKEAWKTNAAYDPYSPIQIDSGAPVQWLADGSKRLNGPEDWGRYRHSRFMPRWASRISLEVTDVRVDQLQEINEADAILEGLLAQDGTGLGPSAGYKWLGRGYHGAGFNQRGERTFHVPDEEGHCSCKIAGPTPAQCAFRELWDSINGKTGRRWSDNPFVWVINFRRMK